MGVPADEVDCASVLGSLGFDTLQQRRAYMDSAFLGKLVNGGMDCPDLLMLIGFAVPSRRLRRHNLFHIKTSHTNYRAFSPLNRMLNSANSRDVDMFLL